MRTKSKRIKRVKVPSIIADLLIANAAFHFAAHVLIKKHQKEFDIIYKKTRSSFDPPLKRINARIAACDLLEEEL